LQAVDALATALSFYIDARKPLPVVSKSQRGQAWMAPRSKTNTSRNRVLTAGKQRFLAATNTWGGGVGLSKRPGRTARVIDPPMAVASKGSQALE